MPCPLFPGYGSGPAWRAVAALSGLRGPPRPRAHALSPGTLSRACHRSRVTTSPSGVPPSCVTMNLDLQCEQLSDARLAELLPQIQQAEVLRLEDCDLTAAQCQVLTSALQANPSLTELSLRSNALGDTGVHLVLQGLQGPACKIRKLSLQNCSLTEAGCQVLSTALPLLPSLLELNLEDNALGDKGVQLLCEGLRDPQCHVESVHLQYCNLTPDSCEALAAMLQARPSLRELGLSNNELGEAGIQKLCQALLGSSSQLEKLNLATCGVTAANCKDLCSILAAKDTLQVLDLGESKLGDAGMAALCPGLLSSCSKLQTLWLWECGISVEGCKELSRVLRTKETLKELSLAANEVGDQGARLLCEALQEPGSRLEMLWVKNCGLSEACCADFSTMLAKNRSLLELQLSNNKLGNVGVQQLCQGLSLPGAKLRSLWLADCDVTNDGCPPLASLLLSNHSLRELDLSNNPIGDPGCLQLLASVERADCTLEQLVLYDIYLSEHVYDRMQALEDQKASLRIIS